MRECHLQIGRRAPVGVLDHAADMAGRLQHQLHAPNGSAWRDPRGDAVQATTRLGRCRQPEALGRVHESEPPGGVAASRGDHAGEPRRHLDERSRHGAPLAIAHDPLHGAARTRLQQQVLPVPRRRVGRDSRHAEADHAGLGAGQHRDGPGPDPRVEREAKAPLGVRASIDHVGPHPPACAAHDRDLPVQPHRGVNHGPVVRQPSHLARHHEVVPRVRGMQRPARNNEPPTGQQRHEHSESAVNEQHHSANHPSRCVPAPNTPVTTTRPHPYTRDPEGPHMTPAHRSPRPRGGRTVTAPAVPRLSPPEPPRPAESCRAPART